MKKIIAFLLIFCLSITPLLGVTDVFAAQTEVKETVTDNIRKDFEADIKYTFEREDDGILSIPVMGTYLRRESVESTGVAVMYVVGHREKRVGTDTDYEILNDMLNSGWAVTVIDYLDDPLTSGVNFSRSVSTVAAAFGSGSYTPGYTVRTGYRYVVPAGCRLAIDINFYDIKEHALNGTNEYIVEVYNTYYAGVKTDNNGNLLPTAETIDDCIKKDGTPIYTKLDMDIVYPANPEEGTVVPVFAKASSNETRQGIIARTDTSRIRPYFVQAALQGYAAVIYDHEYIPMSRNDHYGYNANAFSLTNYNANSVHSAAVRRIRYLADTFGYDAEYITLWGFSKGSLGPAILARTDHEEIGEMKTLENAKVGSNYINTVPEGKDPNEYQGEQPWLYYEGTNEKISSNVTCVFSGSGPGVCNYREVAVTEKSVPLSTSIGTADTTGGFMYQIDNVKNYFDSHPEYETHFMIFEDVAHVPPLYYDEEKQVDTFYEHWKWIDNHIRAAYSEVAPEVLWMTPANNVLYDSWEEPITLQFSRAMDAQSIYDNVKVIRMSDGAEIKGKWKMLHGNTTFEFSSSKIVNCSEYKVIAPTAVKAKDGVNMALPFTKTFTVSGDVLLEAVADTYVSSASPDKAFGEEEKLKINLEQNINEKAYISFNRTGGFDDVTKALLLLGGDEAGEGIIAVSGINGAIDEDSVNFNNAPTGDIITNATVIGEKTSIDVTDFVKENSSENITFSLESTVPRGSVYENDFDSANSSNFRQNTEYRWGAGSATMGFENGSIYIYKRPSGSRLKFIGGLGKSLLTESDIGISYRIKFKINPEEDTNVKVSLFVETGTNYNAYGVKSFEIKAGEWTEISHTITLTKEMVEANTICPTLVVGDTVPYLVDDFVVEYAADPLYITATEAGEDVLCPTLVLYTPQQSVMQANASVVGSGSAADKVLSENLSVSGEIVPDISGTKKGYIKIPISKLTSDTKNVTLNFSASSTGKSSVSVYGALDDDSRFAESPFDNLTWNNAFANEIDGYCVEPDKVYGAAPLATVDTTAETQFSIDVTDYVKYMRDKSYGAVTFIFVQNEQTVSSTLSFQQIDSYNSYSSVNMTGYVPEITDDPTGADNKVFRIRRSGSDGSDGQPSGWNQILYLTGLIKPGGVFEESDIGVKYTISMKAYGKLPEDSSNLTVSGPLFINKEGSTSHSTAFTHSYTVNGKTATGMKGNQWNDIALTFTVTDDIVKNYSDCTALLLTAGYLCSDIYIDDVTVTRGCGESAVTLSGKDLTGSTTDFENTDTYTDYTSANLDGYEKGITNDPTGADNKVFGFLKSGSDGTDGKISGYSQTVSLTGLIKENDIFTTDDIGVTVNVNFDLYVAMEDINPTLRTSINKINPTGAYTTPFDVVTTINGKTATSHTRNTWVNVNMTFTVTSEMVSSYSNYTALALASGSLATAMYVDNIVVTKSYDGEETGVPCLTFDTETENYSEAATISGNTPNSASGMVNGNLAVTKTAVNGVEGLRKTYLTFDKAGLNHVQLALLKISAELLNGEIELYGLNTAALSTLTWNNAPANVKTDNSVFLSDVYKGAPIATLLPENGEYIIDVTDFLKAKENDDKVTFILTAKSGTPLTEISGAELTVYNMQLKDVGAGAEIITSDSGVMGAEVNIRIDYPVQSVEFYVDSVRYVAPVTVNGNVYKVGTEGLEIGEHSVYAVVTYSDGSTHKSDTVTVSVTEQGITGDVDGDGTVNTTDLATLKLYLAGVGGAVHKGADLDSNGEIDTSDLAALKLKLAGYEKSTV